MPEQTQTAMQPVSGQLIKKILIEGTITAKTGLHIGGNSAGMSIGGADATVVRNPLTNQPYIPGSSLKGKMRSLLEKVEGKFGDAQGSTIQVAAYLDISDDTTLIPKLFGTLPEKMNGNHQPHSRLIVRDCEMEKESADKLLKSKNTDMPFTEVKTEVVIDRITSAATPRQLERVPAGAVFNMRLIVNLYHGDSEADFVNKIFESLCLVQNDYLGGKGTRGSGEVSIIVSTVMQKTKDDYEKNQAWKDVTTHLIPTELKKPDETIPAK